MLVSVRGVYRDGKIGLTEKLPDVKSAQVIVTFIPDGQGVDLSVVSLRSRLLNYASALPRLPMTGTHQA